jgi:hypothetical protein
MTEKMLTVNQRQKLKYSPHLFGSQVLEKSSLCLDSKGNKKFIILIMLIAIYLLDIVQFRFNQRVIVYFAKTRSIKKINFVDVK